MQQSTVLSVEKKRKNIYKAESDEEASRSAKKPKFISDAASFKSLDVQPQRKQEIDIKNDIESKYIDIKHEGDSEANDSIADQIQQIKLDEDLRQIPDPNLLQLLIKILNARNMVNKDLADELRYPTSRIRYYTTGSKRASGWNRFEMQLLQWMHSSISHIKEEHKYATKNEIRLQQDLIEKEDQSEALSELDAQIQFYDTFDTFEPENYTEDMEWTNTNEEKKVQLLPDSNLTRLSTPKYMLGSNEPKTDLRLDPLPTFTLALPQTNTGLELDYTYMPYLRPPKPSEIPSANEDQASRFIYEKMLEAWQGDNEFQSEAKKPPSNTPKYTQGPQRNGDKPNYSAKEAAFVVLKNAGKPLSIQEVVRLSIKQGYYEDLNSKVKTLAAAIYRDIKIKEDKSWFVRVGVNRYTINPSFS